MKKIDIIYLMGTGRSGTTALATILGNHPDILTLGEVNQFYNEIDSNKYENESFWECVRRKLPEQDLKKINDFIYAKERHSQISKYLLGIWPSSLQKYHTYQSSMFSLIDDCNPHLFYLDSSKYVGRAMLLSKNKNINLRIINLTRDSRGVIWSFKKKVQTSNTPLGTILYYYIISLFSQITIWIYFKKSSVLQLRYEDVVNKPESTFRKLSSFIGMDFQVISSKIQSEHAFSVPEIIGGNRLKSKDSIIIRQDTEWKNKMSFLEKGIYYFLTLPLNILYKYKI